MTEQLELNFDIDPPKPVRLMSVDEIYENLNEQLIVDAEEDPRVERKPARFGVRPMGEYFSMWANTAPSGGLILIGVDDDGAISGCSDVDVSHLNART